MIKDFKTKLISSIMLRVKAFNEKHRKLAGVTTFFTLILIAILSAILTLVEKICALFGGEGAVWKRALGVLLAVLLLLLMIRTKVFKPQVPMDETDVKGTQVVGTETLVEAQKETGDSGDIAATEESKSDDATASQTDAGADVASDVASGDASTADASADAVSDVAVGDASTVDASATDATSAEDTDQKEERSTHEVKTEVASSDAASNMTTSSTETASQADTSKEAVSNTSETSKTENADNQKKEVSDQSDTKTSEKNTSNSSNKAWDIADIDLAKFQKDYPETVGWVYFEDGHISYPIMQSSDNKKYKSKGYNGEEARTGAIFLDFRSASDFQDYNSIVYGHNMKDRTMFGSLRDYRADPNYYNDHQYFQVIVPGKIYRYQIFAYMDVPVNYVLYDYVGEASYEFVKDAEPVRIKSYMDSEIPVNTSKKVVTLSTCTDKDDLQFVVLGVLVDEEDY